MPETRRRRIDIVLDDTFVEELDTISFEELRSRRELVDQVETELSYHRRLLHGRLDLLDFELRRRSGEESRTLIEALPEILAGSDTPGGGKGRAIRGDFAPHLDFGVGRRQIDRVLDDAFLGSLPAMGDEEVQATRALLADTERQVSELRRTVHQVHDALQRQITERFAADGTG